MAIGVRRLSQFRDRKPRTGAGLNGGAPLCSLTARSPARTGQRQGGGCMQQESRTGTGNGSAGAAGHGAVVVVPTVVIDHIRILCSLSTEQTGYRSDVP